MTVVNPLLSGHGFVGSGSGWQRGKIPGPQVYF